MFFYINRKFDKKYFKILNFQIQIICLNYYLRWPIWVSIPLDLFHLKPFFFLLRIKIDFFSQGYVKLVLKLIIRDYNITQ